MEEVLLKNDEWFLLQIKEGPCSAACTYCYENAHARQILAAAQAAGAIEPAPLDRISTQDLLRLINRYTDLVPMEMQPQEAETIFQILRRSGITRAGLIGSEPSLHRNFAAILEKAAEIGVDLLVYTSGLARQTLRPPVVKYIVLHLEEHRSPVGRPLSHPLRHQKPSPFSVEDLIELLESGKEIHLRVNFSSVNLPEAQFIAAFFSLIPYDLRRRTCLKYSFSTRVYDDVSVAYETPESLRKGANILLRFVDDFATRFDNVRMISERSLFPCAFDTSTWNTYAVRGGFTATCDMEYTFYAGSGLGLCPPARELVVPQSIADPIELRNALSVLRSFLENVYRTPSFECCVPCELREKLVCQGGCLGYKVGKARRPI